MAPEDNAASRFQRGVHFGCGALFGVFLAGLIAWQLDVDVGLALLGSVIGCGLLSAWLGDSFWSALGR